MFDTRRCIKAEAGRIRRTLRAARRYNPHVIRCQFPPARFGPYEVLGPIGAGDIGEVCVSYLR